MTKKRKILLHNVTSELRPPVNNSHKFRVLRVVVIQKIDCIAICINILGWHQYFHNFEMNKYLIQIENISVVVHFNEKGNLIALNALQIVDDAFQQFRKDFN